MKYLIFAGEDYYPLGGMADFYKEVKTIKEAKKFIEQNKDVLQWANIITIENKIFKYIYFGEFTFGMTEWRWTKYKNIKEMLKEEFMVER